MSDINEQEIQVFVDAVNHYFLQITGEKAEIRSAFLAHGDMLPPTYDFTGLITVSGKYRGCIYFSASRSMLSHLLSAMNEPQRNDAFLLDAVGEIANTLAGNARKHFGESMQISVPITMQGASQHLQAMVRARPYVVLIKWKHYEASVIVDVARL